MSAILGQAAIIFLAIVGGVTLISFFSIIILILYSFYKENNKTLISENQTLILRTIGLKKAIWYESSGNYESIGEINISGSSLFLIRNPSSGILWHAGYADPMVKVDVVRVSKDEFIVQCSDRLNKMKLTEKELKETEYYDLVLKAEKLSKFVKEKVRPIIKKYKASQK